MGRGHRSQTSGRPRGTGAGNAAAWAVPWATSLWWPCRAPRQNLPQGTAGLACPGSRPSRGRQGHSGAELQQGTGRAAMGRRTCSEELQLCPERQTQTAGSTLTLLRVHATCLYATSLNRETGRRTRAFSAASGQLRTHTASVALGAVRVGDRGLAQSLCGARHRPRRQTAFPHLLQAVDGRGGWHQLRSPASSAPGPPTPPSEKPGAARAGASPATDH